MIRDTIGPIVQHGYVVADAARAATAWTERVGIGPFYVMENPIDEYVYRGKRTDLTLRIAVSYWRDMQIELIQPVSSAPSFYSESLRTSPDKLNHYAVLVPDMDVAVANLQAERYVVHRGVTPTLSFTYLEHYLPDGTTLELMQTPQQMLQAFEGIKAICRTWDGSRPLRTLADLTSDLAAFQSGAPKR